MSEARRWRAHDRRMEAEGGGLAVSYPEEPSRAFVEWTERAAVERAFVMSKEHKSHAYYVSSFEVRSSLGIVSWRSRHSDARYGEVDRPGFRTLPILGILDGDLHLPDGEAFPTFSGPGFFEAPELVRAYEAWRDADIRGGWSVVTEVDPVTDERMRPLLAALPLLFFTSPPTA